MSKFTIILKSGREMTFEAEAVKITRHSLTGEVIEYSIKGIKSGEVPFSLNPTDIYCAVQIYEEAENEE